MNEKAKSDIRIAEVRFGAKVIREVTDIIRNGSLTTASFVGGARVRALEKRLALRVGVKHAICVNSGTSALLASLIAMGIGRGHEVAIPSLTFQATANAVAISGSKPIFIDVDEDTCTIDPRDLDRKVTKRTKAVIPVHLYGYPADMKAIREVANHHRLRVLEDASQSLGSSFDGLQTGSIGDMGCFSFYGSKVLSCGEGGAITTNDPILAERARVIRNHGLSKQATFDRVGLNLRMPEIEATLAADQLSNLDHFLTKRRTNAKILSTMLKGLKHVRTPGEKNPRKHNWYLYTVRLGSQRDRILKSLIESGIEARIFYDPPIHLTPAYRKLGGSMKLSTTEKLSKEVVSLPIHQYLSRRDLAAMSMVLKRES
ncbi:MAG: DegT/DnrJ/EryC1/StrS family aminotransferase [Thaumarchaeota archaeon]|nr:DegT/DnrJ/EryC1/StrS family aminotransferase [Nitrososphaerota archaeon]